MQYVDAYNSIILASQQPNASLPGSGTPEEQAEQVAGGAWSAARALAVTLSPVGAAGGGAAIECTDVWWHSDRLVSCLVPPGHGTPLAVNVSVCGHRNSSSVMPGITINGMEFEATLPTERPPQERWPVVAQYETPYVEIMRLEPRAGSGNPPLEVSIPFVGSTRPVLPLDPAGGERLIMKGSFFGDPLLNPKPVVTIGGIQCSPGNVIASNSSHIVCTQTPPGTSQRVPLEVQLAGRSRASSRPIMLTYATRESQYFSTVIS